MKALAGVLLAFALAAGISDEASAHRCSTGKNCSKHVAKTSVRHEDKNSCVCRAEKSKLVLTGRLTELNSSPTNCVCSAGKTEVKHVASVSTTKTKHVANRGMIKTKSYGGYKRVSHPQMGQMKNPGGNLGDFDSTKFKPLHGGNLDRGL